MGRFVIRAAWRTDFEDEGWQDEFKDRIRQGIVDRGHHPVGDFSVERLAAEPERDEVVKFYSALVEVAGDSEGWMDLSRETAKRPVVAGPEPDWVGLLDENKMEIQEDWYARIRRGPDGAEFELPEDAEPCAVSYVGEYMEREGGAALRIYAVDVGERALLLQPNSVLYV